MVMHKALHDLYPDWLHALHTVNQASIGGATHQLDPAVTRSKSNTGAEECNIMEPKKLELLAN